jgi:hypothetical protein
MPDLERADQVEKDAPSPDGTLAALRGLPKLADLRPVIVIDCREQEPLTFTRLQSVRGTLYSGDYSILGLEASFAVERKSLDDLANCCLSGNRDRFEHELHWLRGFQFKRLLIIGTREDIAAGLYHSRIIPKAVLATLAAFEIRYSIPVVFCSTPEEAATAIERWVWWFSRELIKLAQALSKSNMWEKPLMHTVFERPADAIPLTSSEKTRLAELESVVETHLETFLTVGRALAQIRNERLYRAEYPSWETYCTKRWGFNYGHANDLVRSTQVAEGLLASCAGPGGDAALPADLSADALRPLQKLEPELQSACWRLASKMGKPTACVVGKIVRTVVTAIEESNGTKPKPRIPQSERKVFVLALHRLSESRIPACVIVQGFDETRVRKLRSVCQGMITRLHEVLEAIRSDFPTL